MLVSISAKSMRRRNRWLSEIDNFEMIQQCRSLAAQAKINATDRLRQRNNAAEQVTELFSPGALYLDEVLERAGLFLRATTLSSKYCRSRKLHLRCLLERVRR
jgi:hypothetical protein